MFSLWHIWCVLIPLLLITWSHRMQPEMLKFLCLISMSSTTSLFGRASPPTYYCILIAVTVWWSAVYLSSTYFYYLSVHHAAMMIRWYSETAWIVGCQKRFFSSPSKSGAYRLGGMIDRRLPDWGQWYGVFQGSPILDFISYFFDGVSCSHLNGLHRLVLQVSSKYIYQIFSGSVLHIRYIYLRITSKDTETIYERSEVTVACFS